MSGPDATQSSATASTPHQQQEQQQQQQQPPNDRPSRPSATHPAPAQPGPLPPLSTTLTTSGPTLSLSGRPPFTATTTYANASARPVRALVRVFAPLGGGLAIRDPARNGRRIGPASRLVGDEWDDARLDVADGAAVRLGPGEAWAVEYVVQTGEREGGLVGSDVRVCVVGARYEVGLRKRRVRWMWEEEGDEGWGEEEWREVLEGREAVEWGVEGCVVEFVAVE